MYRRAIKRKIKKPESSPSGLYIPAGNNSYPEILHRSGFLCLLTAIFFLYLGPTPVEATVLDRDAPVNQDALQQWYKGIWKINLGNSSPAKSRSLIEFDRNKLSLFGGSLGGISDRNASPGFNNSLSNNNPDPSLNLGALNTELFFDTLSNSEELRTIYFSSQQLKFNATLSLMSLIGDDIIKEELEDNRRRQLAADKRLDKSANQEPPAMKNYNGDNLFEMLRNNLTSFLSFVLVLVVSGYLLMRFLGKKI